MLMKKEKKAMNGNLVLFLLGRLVSDTGTSIQMMIMPLYIIDAGGSAATVGIFSFLSMLPALLIYPFAGVIGDRLNRKKIMVVTDFIAAGVIIGLAVISYIDKMSLSLLLVAQVVISLLNGLFEPATRGMMPQLVNKDELTKANSTVASLRSISLLLGPVIGAALYANIGITMVFLVNGISFLLSGVSELMIRYTHVKREAAAGVSGILSDLSEGIKFILRSKLIRKLCVFFMVTYFLVQPALGVALPLFFRTSLKYSDTQYGYLQSIIMLGILLGSIIVGWAFKKEGKLTTPLTIGCALMVGTMLLFSVLMFPNVLSVLGNDSILYFILLAAVLCLFSAANMFIAVPVQTYVQRETPNEYMSRVFSIIAMISRGGMPFGALLYGFVLDRVEIHFAVLIATLLIMVISGIFLTSISKSP